MRDFLFNKHFKLTSFAVGVALGAVLFWAPSALAIFVSAPTDPILTGDITTTEILDGTILVGDIDQTSRFTFESLAIATTSSASSTRFVVDNTGKVGIATTTPGGSLGVTGRVVVSGNISAANIHATGTLSSTGNLSTAGTLTVSAPTTTLNGVEIGWPNAAPATSKFLRITPGGVIQLADGVTTNSGYFEQRETLTGATTIAHGLGAIPSRVSFHSITSVCNAGDTAQFRSESMGSATGTLRAMTFQNTFDASTDGASLDASTTDIIFHETDGDSERHAAYVQTLDATNIVLNFYNMTDDCNALQVGGQPLQIWWTAEL